MPRQSRQCLLHIMRSRKCKSGDVNNKNVDRALHLLLSELKPITMQDMEGWHHLGPPEATDSF